MVGSLPHCPRCRIPLTKTVSKFGLIWVCPDCEGRMVGMGLMRKLFKQEMVNRLWQKSSNSACSSDLPCPSCSSKMSVVAHVTSQLGSGTFDVDVCRLCPLVWFDTAELESSLKTGAKPPPVEPKPLDPKTREALAMMEVEHIRNNAELEAMADNLQDPPGVWWKTLLTLVGVPVEEDDYSWSRWPWVTWSGLLLLILFFLGTWLYPENLKWLAFFPDNPWNYGGLTLITSFFLHANLAHLLVNMVFFGMFGTRCEDFLGHLKFLLLLVAAAIAGPLLHLALDPRIAIPLVGASAGISGIMAFYALQFPSARLIYLVRLGLFFRWIRIPAVVGFAIWLGMQTWGALSQVNGLGEVSFLGHLGGAVVGLGYWATLRFLPTLKL